jgi:outer membrane protease
MEYQRYFETRGGTKIFDAATPTYLRLPKPAAGAESETVLFSLGLKAHL